MLIRNPRGVFGLQRLVDSEYRRYSLGGVRLSRENGRSMASATDGRVLGIVTWYDYAMSVDSKGRSSVADTQPTKFEAIVSGKDCQRLQKINAEITVNEDATKINGTLQCGTVSYKPKRKPLQEDQIDLLDGGFPKVLDVVPHYDEHNSISIAVDPELLAKLLLAASAVQSDIEEGKRRHKTVVLTLSNSSTSDTNHTRLILLTANGDEGEVFVGVIMPITADDGTKPEPLKAILP